MGPIRSLTGMIDDITEQTNQVTALTRRLRDANKRLTGSTALDRQAEVAAQEPRGPVEVLPTLARLTLAIEGHGSAVTALRDEIAYMEQFSETGESEDKLAIKHASGLANSTQRY
jgi:hypothetical protein